MPYHPQNLPFIRNSSSRLSSKGEKLESMKKRCRRRPIPACIWSLYTLLVGEGRKRTSGRIYSPRKHKRQDNSKWWKIRRRTIGNIATYTNNLKLSLSRSWGMWASNIQTRTHTQGPHKSKSRFHSHLQGTTTTNRLTSFLKPLSTRLLLPFGV